MKLSIYYYLDNWVINLAAFLHYQFHISFLADRFQALTHNSNHDKIIYAKMVDLFQMTPFEKKIIENEAFRENFSPNGNLLLKALANPEYSDNAQLFILASNINIEEAKWDMAEIIELNIYKQSKSKLQRIYDMINYYHKQHFFMGLKNANK